MNVCATTGTIASIAAASGESIKECGGFGALCQRDHGADYENQGHRVLSDLREEVDPLIGHYATEFVNGGCSSH
jgi:hypothetical protein